MTRAKPKPKKALKRGPGRPPTLDPAKVARGVMLLEQGDPERAVAVSRASLRTLYRARDAAAAARAPAPPEVPAPVDANADPSPLAVLRRLLAALEGDLAALDADSPRRNPARANAVALARAITAIDAAQPKPVPPDEVRATLEALDAETEALIEQHLADQDAALEQRLAELRTLAGAAPQPLAAMLLEKLSRLFEAA